MIINKEYLKQFSPLPKNYNLDEVLNYVDVAAKIWLIPIIGGELYDEIEEQVQKNEVSDTNATLLIDGGLYQYLSFATVLEALPIIWGHFSEVGITKGKSENSDSLSLKDLTLIQQHMRNQVEVLKDLLIKWLDDHYDSFPLYHPSDCGCSSCCAKRGKLNSPNKNQQLWSMRRICTELR